MRRLNLDLALPLAGIAVFSWFYFPNAGLVGLCLNDAYIGRIAWAFLHQAPGMMEGPVTLRLFGLTFPLNWNFSHGPGEFYSTAPFVWIFGPTAAAMHWRSASCAFVSIAATYRAGLSLYRDRWAAFFAGTLLAASPSLAGMSFYGGDLGAAEVAAGMAGLCLLLLYAERRRPAFAYGGCAALGFAVSCRSTMFAFVFGLGVYACLFHREIRALLPERPKERARFLAACAGLIMIFCVPLLIAHLAGGIWPALRSHLIVQESGTRNFFDYGSSLRVRFHQLQRILNDLPYTGRFQMSDFPAHPASGLLVDAALLAGMLLALRAAVLKKAEARRWMLPCVVAAAYLLLSPFCPTEIQTYHLFPILPLACLTAASVVAMPRRGAARAPLILAFLLFTGYRVGAGAALFRDFHAQASRSRVFAVFEDLNDRLVGRPGERPVFLCAENCGERARLLYLSAGKFSDFPDVLGPSFDLRWDELLRSDRTLFVVTADAAGESPPFLRTLEARARRRGVVLARVDSIRRPNGVLAFDLYRAAPAPEPALSRAAARLRATKG